MEGKRVIRTIEVQNFLSYGSDSPPIQLAPLNVLIGPNASGKSNLIEALGLLRAAPADLTAPIREGGGIGEWLWKGDRAGPSVKAKIEATVDYPPREMPLRYRLCFTRVGQGLELLDEVVENERITRPDREGAFFFYRFQEGHPVLSVAGEEKQRKLHREDLSPDQSVLSQRKDPDLYPEITYLGKLFGSIHLFREWNLGRYTAPRLPQRPDLAGDFLQPDAANLGLVLNYLEHQPGVKKQIIGLLGKFCGRAEDITVKIYGGTIQIFVHEKGLSAPVPATRLSDGMLRYLCLLTVLCHPSPPPVVCIEEPELGLHPDVIPRVAELLIEASSRTQLFVTTHSDLLVSALSEVPEAVLVCENNSPCGTTVRRLEAEPLRKWLEKFSLGELWLRGELGGTRW